MKKRVFAAVLWFYVGWYGGAMLAEFLGVSPMLGPIIGTDCRRVVRRGPTEGHLVRSWGPTGSRDGAPDGDLGAQLVETNKRPGPFRGRAS